MQHPGESLERLHGQSVVLRSSFLTFKFLSHSKPAVCINVLSGFTKREQFFFSTGDKPSQVLIKKNPKFSTRLCFYALNYNGFFLQRKKQDEQKYLFTLYELFEQNVMRVQSTVRQKSILTPSDFISSPPEKCWNNVQKLSHMCFYALPSYRGNIIMHAGVCVQVCFAGR